MKILLDDIEKIISQELMLSEGDLEGSYLYQLKRVKSAFNAGTMILDDFEEVDEEVLHGIMNRISGIIIKHNDGLEKEIHRLRRGIVDISKNIDCDKTLYQLQQLL